MRENFRILPDSVRETSLRSDYLRIGRGRGELYGGNQSAFGGLIENTGCGLIAMGDISLYLSGKTKLTTDEYQKYIRDFNARFVRLRMLGGLLGKLFGMCSIDGRSGILLRGYFRKNRTPLSARAVPLPVSRRDMKKPACDRKCFRLIERSLSADKPVIIGVGVSKSHKLPMYVRNADDPALFERKNATSNHYVTVTGALVCTNAETQEQTVLFRISSWGKMYYIDLDELYEHVTADKGLYGFAVGRISNNLTLIKDKK